MFNAQNDYIKFHIRIGVSYTCHMIRYDRILNI